METSEDILAIEDELIVSGKPEKSIFNKILMLLLKLSLAAVIIGWMIYKHHTTFVDSLKDFNYWWLIPACSCYIFHMWICSWRWYKLAEVLKIKISLLEATALTMKGYFFSLVIPGGAVGGDVAKIGFLTTRAEKGTKAEGIFSVLMDRIVGMVALFSLAIVVIIMAIPILMRVETDLIKINDTMRILGIIGLLLLCAAGLIAMLAIFFHRTLVKIPLVAWLMRQADKRAHGMVGRLTAAIDTYRASWKLLSWLTLVSIFLVHLNIVLVVYFIIKGLGIDVTSGLAVIAAVTIGNIAGLIPLTPSGTGIRDVTVSVILIAGGVSSSPTIPLMLTAMILFFDIAAGIFFIFDPDKRKTSAAKCGVVNK